MNSDQFTPDFYQEGGPESDRFARLRSNLSPRDRQAAMQQKLEEKEACERCGSTWFAEITFNQYRRGQYSASPGGGLETINVMPMPTLVCLCGFPVLLGMGGTRGGPTPNKDLTSYDASVRAAQTHLLEVQQPQLPDVTPQVQSLVASMVGTNLATSEELDTLRGQVQMLAREVELQADAAVAKEALDKNEFTPMEEVGAELRRGPGRPKKVQEN
jgi:hypothetical protein